MSTENKDDACTICHGTGINDQKDKDKLDNDGNIIYYPIECQNCKGAGKEPT